MNNNESPLFDLEVTFDKANVTIESLVEIYGIISKAGHSANFISNFLT